MDCLAEISASAWSVTATSVATTCRWAAVARGAKIIEKHFTTDKTLEGNDHTVSLLPGESKAAIQQTARLRQLSVLRLLARCPPVS